MNGLPNINIVFKNKAESVKERSKKGIVLMIIRDDTDSSPISETYDSLSKVPYEKLKKRNFEYISLAFKACPDKVHVLNIKDVSLDTVLEKLMFLRFNYLTMPEATREEVPELSAFIISAREQNKKTFKAVLPSSASESEAIINFTSDNITSSISDEPFTSSEYCARIAGVLASLSLDRSATYYELTDILSMDLVSDSDERVKIGELIIIYDGEKYKIARGVNSFTKFSDSKGKDFSKIKIVDAMDLYADDVRAIFENHYIGKCVNDYDGKQALISAINAYNKSIEGVMLDKFFENKTVLDLEAQKKYLSNEGVDVKTMKDIDIKTANTATSVFITSRLKFVDAMEDLEIKNRL